MKTIQEKINNILVTTRTPAVKSALRIVKAEFQREKTKEISDERALKIIRTLIASEQERMKHIDVFKKGGSEEKTEAVIYIQILSSYLPIMVGEEVIRDWIISEISFSNYKNPLGAIKDVQAHFGTEADPVTIREVIQKLI